MSFTGKAWAAFRDVLRLQDDVERLTSQVAKQQTKIETLHLEVAQLKMAVSILLGHQGLTPPKPPFSPPHLPSD